jgi:hypothetical protein
MEYIELTVNKENISLPYTIPEGGQVLLYSNSKLWSHYNAFGELVSGHVIDDSNYSLWEDCTIRYPAPAQTENTPIDYKLIKHPYTVPEQTMAADQDPEQQEKQKIDNKIALSVAAMQYKSSQYRLQRAQEDFDQAEKDLLELLEGENQKFLVKIDYKYYIMERCSTGAKTAVKFEQIELL